MQLAVSAGLLGNASLLTAGYGKIGVESKCIAIRCGTRRAAAGKTAVTTAIQD